MIDWLLNAATPMTTTPSGDGAGDPRAPARLFGGEGRIKRSMSWRNVTVTWVTCLPRGVLLRFYGH